MAEHYVGLDIGSFAVRAAEISGEPGSWTLHRFAQLTLPPGAVVDGEIVDSRAVTEAIKALWARGDFKSKKVSVGIANRWVKVRQAEVPALSPDEVRTSLRYEAQEVIPFAEEDAIVDFVVQDRFAGPEGGEFLRILVVAAQRQMVSMTLETVRKAGLTPAHVDLTPVDNNRSVSRRHAKIIRTGHEYHVLEEVGTVNGTYVNDQRIPTGVPVTVHNGDLVKIGLISMKAVFD